MKLVCVSDLHLDATTDGFPRFGDVAEALRTAEQVAVDERADYFVCLGDVSDPDRDRNPAIAEHLCSLALRLKASGVRSRWLTGNHDAIEDGSGTSTLEPLRALEGDGMICVWNAPTTEVVGRGMTAAMLVALPFVPRAISYDPVKFVEAIDSLGLPVVVFSHLSVEGIEPGGETFDMPRGRDVFLPTKALRAKDFRSLAVVQGHFHKATDVNIDGVSIHVVGALACLTHGEERNRPTFSILELS